jgi:4-hydroxybutyrate CoA-transferase
MPVSTTAREAIDRIPAGARVFVGHECGTPLTLLDALQERAQEGPLDLQLYLGLMLAEHPLFQVENAALRMTSYHLSAAVMPAYRAGRLDYLPLRYSQAARTFLPDGPLPVDVLLTQVAPGRAGQWSLGLSVGTTAELALRAPLVIAEVNAQAPFTLGEAVVPDEAIDVLVEADYPPVPLPQAQIGAVERRIGELVASLVPDEATLQVGIGAIPDALLEALRGHRDLGFHSGLLNDRMWALVEAGVATGAAKTIDPGKVVCAEVLATHDLFPKIDRRKELEMRRGTYTHNPSICAQQHRFVAINSAIEVDFMGQVNAESIDGAQITGIGGQFDFMEGAAESDGLSIIALPSTAAGGKKSRIVPRLSHGATVSTPRFCVSHVVTEHGIADLRAKTLRERESALRAIMAPEFRESPSGQ